MTLALAMRDDGTMPPNASPSMHGLKHRLAFSRSEDQKMISGLAGGLAEHLGVDPLIIRAALIMLSVAGGAGLGLYVAGLLLAQPPGAVRPIAPPRNGGERAASLVCFSVGALLAFRRAGLWIGDQWAWPLAILLTGSLVVWMRRPGADTDLRRISSLLQSPPSPGRLVVGLALTAIGVASLGIGVQSVSRLGGLIGPLVALAVGSALFGGPLITRLLADLSNERRQRIRTEERAEIGAHLHDSVLQTLAMIQRQAHDPAATVQLARRQERELRSWLYSERSFEALTLARSVQNAVDDIEAAHHVKIDLVTVGQVEPSASVVALIGAVKEAATNAAKHAGVATISVYVEATPTNVSAFVRDRGVGFVEADVPDDRLGLRDSIRGRLARHGGTVVVDSRLGEGTEVTMTVPIEDR